MNDTSWKKLGRAAMAVAAEVMDSVDPDDRTASEVDLVDLAKEMIDAANKGDRDAQDLIFEACPSWVAPEIVGRWRAERSGT